MKSKIDLVLLGNTKKNTFNLKKKYTNVCIYPATIANKNKFSQQEKTYLTRKGFKWYLYYSYFYNGKMVRQPPIYLSLNRDYKKFDDRRSEILKAQKALISLLEDGYSPYQDQTLNNYTVKSCFDYVLNLKKTM